MTTSPTSTLGSPLRFAPAAVQGAELVSSTLARRVVRFVFPFVGAAA